MGKLIDLLSPRVRRVLFLVYFWFFLLLAILVILAPRPLLVRWYGTVWTWLLLIPPVCWLVGFIRSLYRGGE